MSSITDNKANIDPIKLLETNKDDLKRVFRLRNDEEVNNLIEKRALLRKEHLKKQEKLDIKDVAEFTYEKVCQLLEQEIGANSDAQSINWYTSIEDNGITGTSLLTMAANELEELIDLKLGQKPIFKNLLKRIQDKPKTNATISLNDNSSVGLVCGEGTSTVNGNIQVYSSGSHTFGR